MCGINGIAGSGNIAPRLFKGILNLEYRGYDSCGLALIKDHEIVCRKNVGKILEVNTKERLEELEGSTGIAHTRWATHGGVTQANSHPHLSQNGDFALVHNGIISNYLELKKALQEQGIVFRSETDTEVAAQLLGVWYQRLGNVEAAFRKMIEEIEGTFAFAVVTKHEPEKIYCAKRSSPLIIGVGTKENFVGSDVNAFLDFTKRIVYLNDNEYAIVERDSYVIKDLHTGDIVPRAVTTIEWDREMTKKGGFPNYMLKEIHEQPQAIETVLSIDRGQVRKLAGMMRTAERTYLLGVGTTFYVALTGQYYFSQVCARYVPAVLADEYRGLIPPEKGSLVVAISQSGETHDTLDALKAAKGAGASTAAIINAIGSTMSREVDLAVMQGSGPEICVLSTKAALAQIVLLMRVALELAEMEGKVSAQEYVRLSKVLKDFPELLRQVINERVGFMKVLAQRHHQVGNWLYIGRGVYHAIALEAALKMKEVTYLHAEGMSGGFLKHGTIALIDETVNTVAFVPPPQEKDLREAIMSNVAEIKARKGKVIGIHFEPGSTAFAESVVLPPADPFVAPLLELVIGQLLAYHTAIVLKRDPDKPRSLAKSVTVP